MGKIVKRGGKRQSFSAAKIRKSVQDASRDAKISVAKARGLVKDIAEPVIAHYKGKKTVLARDLRRSILGRLDRRMKKVSNAWRRYDQKRKR